MHVLANGAGRNLRSTIINHLKIVRIMKQRIKKFCDEYMWFILPAFSSIAIMLGVVIEKHFPLSEILSKIL